MYKLAICIPSYNRVDLVKKLINSIPSDVGIFISDNGGYLRDAGFKSEGNIHIYSFSDVKEMFDNWNYAASLADGKAEYIAITSDDDIYCSGFFEKVECHLDGKSDCYIFGNYFIDKNDCLLDQYVPEIKENLIGLEAFEKYKYGVKVRMPSVFFKNDFFKESGGFDSGKFKITAADSELIQRTLLLGRTTFIPEIISCYRVWDGSLTNEKALTKQWLDEVDSWTDKIIELGKGCANLVNKNFSNSYKDEIYARNIIFGLTIAVKHEKYSSASDFLKVVRWPSKCNFKTKCILVKLIAMIYYHKLCS